MRAVGMSNNKKQNRISAGENWFLFHLFFLFRYGFLYIYIYVFVYIYCSLISRFGPVAMFIYNTSNIRVYTFYSVFCGPKVFWYACTYIVCLYTNILGAARIRMIVRSVPGLWTKVKTAAPVTAPLQAQLVLMHRYMCVCTRCTSSCM